MALFDKFPWLFPAIILFSLGTTIVKSIATRPETQSVVEILKTEPTSWAIIGMVLMSIGLIWYAVVQKREGAKGNDNKRIN